MENEREVDWNIERLFYLQTVNLSNGLSLNEAEGAITTIAAVHALTLGMKLKEKVDLNEKYPVSWLAHTHTTQWIDIFSEP